jgi:citrate lyase beta subunit
MIHFKHLTGVERKEVFFKEPQDFNRKSPKEILSKALGAALYMPATRETIAVDIINKKHISLTTIVMDLEDAVGDDQVNAGEENLILQLNKLQDAIDAKIINENHIPILFLRVRNPEHLRKLLQNGKKLERLTGFVFPKFSTLNADNYLETLEESNQKWGTTFYAMPILETENIIYKETRMMELSKIQNILNVHRDTILNVRIGGTDFSGLYSLRRSMDTTIYDILVVRDCISDILNVFNRAKDGFVVSGIVWEFFSNHNRILKPELRETPFIKEKGKNGRKERNDLLHRAFDGLIKEVMLDKTNGITGKTIIHPSHITFVNALQVVTQEEYEDALMVTSNKDKGVLKSTSGNKMNEIKPHQNWANNILQKSHVYGVLRNDKNYNSLF